MFLIFIFLIRWIAKFFKISLRASKKFGLVTQAALGLPSQTPALGDNKTAVPGAIFVEDSLSTQVEEKFSAVDILHDEAQPVGSLEGVLERLF